MDNAYKTGAEMYDMLGIGDAGCYARIKNEYDTSVTIYDKRLACYYGDVREGGVIVDKRPCFTDEKVNEAIHLVCSGPMLKLTLDNGMMQKLWEKPEKYNGEARALDYVSLDVYCKLWRDLGARIGRRVGQNVIWDDGSVERIVDESNRWKIGR